MKTYNEIKKDVLDILPKSRDDAKTVDELALLLKDKHPTIRSQAIRKCIKEIRLSGIPVLWCNKGSFISDNIEEINHHIDNIENMIGGFAHGMNKIKSVLFKFTY